MGKTKTKRLDRPGGKQVGRFHVEFEVANNYDVERAERDELPARQIRRATIEGIVDSGAASLVLPQKIGEELGLRVTGKVRVKYADGRFGFRDKTIGVFVSLQGRDGVFNAVLEPKRD